MDLQPCVTTPLAERRPFFEVTPHARRSNFVVVVKDEVVYLTIRAWAAPAVAAMVPVGQESPRRRASQDMTATEWMREEDDMREE